MVLSFCQVFGLHPKHVCAVWHSAFAEGFGSNMFTHSFGSKSGRRQVLQLLRTIM